MKQEDSLFIRDEVLQEVLVDEGDRNVTGPTYAAKVRPLRIEEVEIGRLADCERKHPERCFEAMPVLASGGNSEFFGVCCDPRYITVHLPTFGHADRMLPLGVERSALDSFIQAYTPAANLREQAFRHDLARLIAEVIARTKNSAKEHNESTNSGQADRAT